MFICLILVSLVGLYGVARSSKRMADLYFICVVLIIAFQAVVAIHHFLMGTAWMDEALDRSWNTALVNDPELIYDLQTEFHCQGFDSRSPGSLEAYPRSDYLPSCGAILKMNFGKRLEKLGSTLLVIRLLQLSGVLLLSILFKYLATVDREESAKGDGNIMVRTTEKLEYGLTEKQLEDMHARVPILVSDGIDECGLEGVRIDIIDREARGDIKM